MTRELSSVAVWLGVFLAVELPAKDILGVWPWYSLSRTVEVGTGWWWPVGLWLVVFMLVLLCHFEMDIHWSYRWVVLTGVCGVVLIVSHLIPRLA